MGGFVMPRGKAQPEERRERTSSGVFLKQDDKQPLLAAQKLGMENPKMALLVKSIRELDWPVHIIDYLEKYSSQKPAYVYELVQMTEKEVSPYVQARGAIVYSVQQRLRALGLSLGMKLDETTVTYTKGRIAGEKMRLADEQPDPRI